MITLKKTRLLASILSLTLLISGCSMMAPHAPTSYETTAPERPSLPTFNASSLLMNSPYESKLSLSQTIDIVVHAPKKDDIPTIPTMSASIEQEKDSFEVVMSAFLQPVWRLHISPSGIDEWRNKHVPAFINQERFLRDIVFTLYPTRVLAKTLPAGYLIREDAQSKTLLLNQEPVMILTKKLQKNVDEFVLYETLQNIPEHYTLLIQTKDRSGN